MIKNQNFKRNSHIDDLINDAVNNNEGVIGLNGALMVDTGEFSGRIPNDKFIVDEDSSTEKSGGEKLIKSYPKKILIIF